MSCVFKKKSKRGNTNWKLVARLRGKTGRGEKLASGKNHDVGEEGAYVRSTYLGCARRYTTERKRCGDT